MFGVSPKYFIVRYGEDFTVEKYAEGLDRLHTLGFSFFQGEVYKVTQLKDWERNAGYLNQKANELNMKIEMFVAHFLFEGFSFLESLKDKKYEEYFLRVLEMASAFNGLKTICVPIGRFNSERTEEAKEAMEKRIELFSSLSNKRGLLFAVEVMNGSLLGIPEIASFRKKKGIDNLGINLDTGHANLMLGKEIVNVPSMIPIYGTHIKDNDGINPDELKPGDGSIPWRELMSSLKKAGYMGSYDFELSTDRDEEYLAAISYLKNLK